MDKTSLGDRMKGYESLTENRIMPRVPVIVRLDGRSFSKFTKGMQKPFDNEFRQAMIEVTKYLVEQTHAKIGYTQSDEISLVLYDNAENASIIFDGRIQKIASNFASMASAKFLLEMQKRFPDKVDGSKTLPSFDARVFAVPNETEAANAIVWRVQDATKNSVAMVAQHHFSHKSLQNIDCLAMKEKLIKEKGIDWEKDFSSAQKQGVFIRKEIVSVKLEEEKLNKIPVDKRPEGGMVTRNKIVEIDMPDFLKVTNRTQVIFDGEMPSIEEIVEINFNNMSVTDFIVDIQKELLKGKKNGSPENNFWEVRALNMLEPVLDALFYLRNKGQINNLSISKIRKYLKLEKITMLVNSDNFNISKDIKDDIKEYLESLPGYEQKKGGKQLQVTINHHGLLEGLINNAMKNMK